MIAVEGLRKSFGRRLALDDLSFEVAEGEAFGLTGPRGSGRTTVMRILATLLLPDAGEATIGGFSVVREPRDVKRIVGYLPQRIGVYDRQSAREVVEFRAGLHKVRGPRRGPLALQLLEVVGLADHADDEATSLEAGDRCRLALAACLVQDPAVLLLDDPMANLDADSAQEVRALLSELARVGKTIVATARNADSLTGVCTTTLPLP